MSAFWRLDANRNSHVRRSKHFFNGLPALRSEPPAASPPGASPPAVTDRDARQWAMLLHLSQFAGFVIPVAGLVAPILIWQLKKDEIPGLDEHGKEVLNWIISEFIYVLVGVVLTFVIVGIPLLIAVGIASIAFPIIGGLKANEGRLWRYPLTIRLVK